MSWRHKLSKAISSPNQAGRYAYVAFRYCYFGPVMYFYSFRRKETAALKRARQLHENEYRSLTNPLISVTIATYNRGQLLEERAIQSVLNQTYSNFEIIVVGDGCTDDTGDRIQRLNDPRIRYINLPERSKYPEDPQRRWMVAGTPPVNRAMAEARGAWIAHLDDDEIFEPEHLATLVAFSQESDAEFIYSRSRREIASDEWIESGSYPPINTLFHGHNIAHSTAMFRRYLRLFQFDIDAWKYHLAVDHHVWLRMQIAGVRFGFVDMITNIAPLRPSTTTYSYHAEDRL